jgi:hypothetical protein
MARFDGGLGGGFDAGTDFAESSLALLFPISVAKLAREKS